MAYDDDLAERARAILDTPGLSERKMFGGLCFMFHGNMACGVMGSDLMVRVGPDAYEEALAQPDAREMDFTGRPMKGIVHVDGAGVSEDGDLRAWLDRGMSFAGSLPPK